MSKFSSIRDVEHFIRKNSRVEFPPTANFDLLLEAIQEVYFVDFQKKYFNRN